MDFVHKIEQVIQEKQLLQQGDVIIVAVSGGPDSVALLHVLHQLSSAWQFQLVVAHVNHQFRGTESDQEAEAVEVVANALGLPYEIGRIDVPEYIRTHTLNTQAAARKLRYEYLFQ